MIELTVAELAEVTELDLGASPWRRIDQAMVDLFGPGGSGFLALSLVPVMFKQILRITAGGSRGPSRRVDRGSGTP